MPDIQRQTAFKIWLSELDDSVFVKSSKEFEPSYFLVKDKKISRVNVIATIVNKNITEAYGFLTLDDSTSQIRVKAWREDVKILDNVSIADTALIIGKLREYNNEMYIIPEVVKKVNLNWELVRKLELAQERGSPVISTKDYRNEEIENTESSQAEIPPSNLQLQLISIIDSSNDSGIEIEEICRSLNKTEEEIMPSIKNLLMEGQIFEILPGRYKVLK